MHPAQLEQLELPFVLRDLLTVSQAARILDLSGQMVRLLADSGRLPHARVGPDGHRYFQRQTVEALRQEREVAALLSGAKRRGPKPVVTYVARERRTA